MLIDAWLNDLILSEDNEIKYNFDYFSLEKPLKTHLS